MIAIGSARKSNKWVPHGLVCLAREERRRKMTGKLTTGGSGIAICFRILNSGGHSYLLRHRQMLLKGKGKKKSCERHERREEYQKIA